MGCFSGLVGEDDGMYQDPNLRTLRSILATKQAPWPSPCPAKRTIQRTLAFFLSRRTTRARARLLDRASQSLARAKVQIISQTNSPQSEQATSTNYSANHPVNHSVINHSESTENQTVLYYPLPTPNSTVSHLNSNVSGSNSNPILANSHNINSASSLFYCVFSVSNDSSNSLSSSFSAVSANDSSSSTNSNRSNSKGNLRCSSMSHIDHESFSAPCPLPPLPNSLSATVSVLREFLPQELSEACDNFSVAKKLRDSAMGPVYQGTIKALSSSGCINGDKQESLITVQIARVATNLSRKRWKTQIQWLARQTHPNLCRILGFSYERARLKSLDQLINDNCAVISTNHVKYTTRTTNSGFVVYAEEGSDPKHGHGSLDKLLLQQGGSINHGLIDSHTLLKIAIGAAEGLAFLLERIPPTQIIYNKFEASSIQLDSSYNAKLIDFTFIPIGEKESSEACAFDMRGFGILLLQLFGFIKYPYNRDLVNYDFDQKISRVSPMKDTKLIIDLAIRCLMPNSSLQPSIMEVVQSLRNAQQTSKRKRRSSSFG